MMDRKGSQIESSWKIYKLVNVPALSIFVQLICECLLNNNIFILFLCCSLQDICIIVKVLCMKRWCSLFASLVLAVNVMLCMIYCVFTDHSHWYNPHIIIVYGLHVNLSSNVNHLPFTNAAVLFIWNATKDLLFEI